MALIKAMFTCDTSQNDAIYTWKDEAKDPSTTRNGLFVDDLSDVRNTLDDWKNGDEGNKIVQIIVFVKRKSGTLGDKESKFCLGSEKSKDWFKLDELANLASSYLDDGGLVILGDGLVTASSPGELSNKSKILMTNLARSVGGVKGGRPRYVWCNENETDIFRDGDKKRIRMQGDCWRCVDGIPEPQRVVLVGNGGHYFPNFMEEPVKKRALIFVLDHSGSMKFHKEIDYLKHGVKIALQKYISNRNHFALLGYNKETQHIYPENGSLAKADHTSVHNAIKKEGQVSAHDSTATGDALEKALEMLQRNTVGRAKEKVKEGIILITDGYRNHGKTYKKACKGKRKISALGILTIGKACKENEHKKIEENLEHESSHHEEINFNNKSDNEIQNLIRRDLSRMISDIVNSARGYKTKTKKEINLLQDIKETLAFSFEKTTRFIEVTVTWDHQNNGADKLVEASLKSKNTRLTPYHEAQGPGYQHAAYNARLFSPVSLHLTPKKTGKATVVVAYHDPM